MIDQTISGVYFFQAHTGEIKIGYSDDIERRFRSLSGANPRPITCLGVIPNFTTKDETKLHHKFSAFRIQYEWFSPAIEILHYISHNAVQVDLKTLERDWSSIGGRNNIRGIVGRPKKNPEDLKKRRQFRATDEEYAAICEAAERSGKKIGAWIRETVLRAAKRVVK